MIAFEQPPDQDQRDLILNELDVNMLVEAAAGTGKTTCMLSRMVALLRTGRCADVGDMAAVTFTRKASAELRSRFHVALEKAMRQAQGSERDNLERALATIEQCYIGTIHSFCARLLRERPVEAGVDLDFSEVDDVSDGRLRQDAWNEYLARLYANDPDGLLAELRGLAIEPRDLEGAFMRFADFPDVQEWPVPACAEPPEVEAVVEALLDYTSHMRALQDRLPTDNGSCRLLPAYKRLPRVVSHYDDLSDMARLVEVLETFDRAAGLTQKPWLADDRFTRDECKAEARVWDEFRAQAVRPFLEALRECRYGPVMRVMFEARDIYDELRKDRAELNFQDLLMKAAALLRDKPHVRRYFSRRFTHLLVDEFQDTDPIQAEVMVLLTADDPRETDWRRCRPRPGSLFVVGDPKQSIYRFRRADIVAYDEVKDIIFREEDDVTSGADRPRDGMMVRLSANFRSVGPLIDWVNGVFAPDTGGGGEPEEWLRFPDRYSDESPSYVPLQCAREAASPGELEGVYTLLIPDDLTQKEDAIDYEADRIARTIRAAVDDGVTVPRTRREVEDGAGGAVGFSDFMIVTHPVKHLSVYARKLQEYGIPHRVTGGRALNEMEELQLLHLCLKSVTRPDDPVALVAVLRSELFGVSDAALYSFKKGGGRFSYSSVLPEGLPDDVGASFGDAFERLKRYSGWLSKLPPVSAFERITSDLGLVAFASGRPGGDVQAGSLLKAIEVLREGQKDMWTTAQLVEYLGMLVDAEETYDGISARSEDRPAVRVMNLHKAKGLEAPFVFLADPSGGGGNHPVELHVDRSRDRVVGYMAVYLENNRRRTLVANPEGWESLTETESRFLGAERLRLRYVAATRAAAGMAVTRRNKSAGSNTWRHLVPFLEGHPEIVDPGARNAPVRPRTTATAEAVAGAKADIAAGRDLVKTPTYEVSGAKAYALAASAVPGTGQMPSTAPAEGEHGVEWGSVIHSLLEVAMKEPSADLERLAGDALAERELDPGLARTAAYVVRGVMASDIWGRARASERFLTEVPFQVLAGEETSVPTVLRGAIDLVFKEDGGWVVVDYKTDAFRGSPDALVEQYAPQVRLYATAWERCSGEPVRETALYFVKKNLLVPFAR